MKARATTSLLTVTPSFGYGGAERLLVNLTNGLTAWSFEQTIVSLGANNALARALSEEACTFIAAPRASRYDLRPAHLLRAQIARQRPDVVCCYGVFCYLYTRLALLGLREQPALVVALHSTTPRTAREARQRQLFTRVLQTQDQLVAVAQAQADYWAHNYGIPSGRFIVLYNGVNTDHFQPGLIATTRDSVRQQYAIPLDAPVIALVAALRPEKRHSDAISALHLLNIQRADRLAYMLIVGEGSEDTRLRLEKEAAIFRVDEYIRFVGAQQDVRPFYEAADLFTLTSNAEAFSLAALEAMAMGLPGVITDVGGARETLDVSICGQIVPPNNPEAVASAWAEVIRQLPAYDGTRIRKRVVEQFSLRRCVADYARLVKLWATPGAMA